LGLSASEINKSLRHGGLVFGPVFGVAAIHRDHSTKIDPNLLADGILFCRPIGHFMFQKKGMHGFAPICTPDPEKGSFAGF
jgi:hypothetical protein